MDEDLTDLSREQLIDEIKRLRGGIRSHRDSSGDHLRRHHPALWGLLPETQDPRPTVPDWPAFMRLCEIPGIAGRAGPRRTAHLQALRVTVVDEG